MLLTHYIYTLCLLLLLSTLTGCLSFEQENKRPVALVNDDMTAVVGSTVTLSGANSHDPEKEQLTFRWNIKSNPEGSSSSFDGNNQSSVTFIPDIEGEYEIELIVNDGEHDSEPAHVIVTVIRLPEVTISLDSNKNDLQLGSEVYLSGSIGDIDEDKFTFKWSLVSKPDKSSAAIENSNSLLFQFTPDIEGTYAVVLTISEDRVEKASHPLEFKIERPNTDNFAPVANAGADQNIKTGSLVTLDGSASSDPDLDVINYRWTITSSPEGSIATLSLSSIQSPTFIADIDGTYVIALVVNDGIADSSVDSVVILAETQNVPPVAATNTELNGVAVNQQYSLDATASYDADNDQLTYNWELTSLPSNEANAELSNKTSAIAAFTTDSAGEYVITLVVNDGKLDSTPLNLIVNVIEDNVLAPVARAGDDQSVEVGEEVSLDGASSYSSSSLHYLWSLISYPEGGEDIELVGETLASATFTPAIEGDYLFTLTVTDSQGQSATDNVTIHASDSNMVVVANAGLDQDVTVGNIVYLDARESKDKHSKIAQYDWHFKSLPENSEAKISGNDITPTFIADEVGEYVITLTLYSSDAVLSTDVVIVNARLASGNVGSTTLHIQSADDENSYEEVGLALDIDTGPISTKGLQLDSFKLTASESDITIINVAATIDVPGTFPSFIGLESGYKISKGEVLNFSTYVPEVTEPYRSITYTFEVYETGEVYTINYFPMPILILISPKYPVDALIEAKEGWIELQFAVTTLGSVDDIVIVDHYPSDVFDREATLALAKWKFKPKVVDGVAIRVNGIRVVLEFKLSE